MNGRAIASELPSELLFLIFGQLRRNVDLPSAALVCRSWSVHASHVKWTTSIVPLSVLLQVCQPVQEGSDDWSNVNSVNPEDDEVEYSDPWVSDGEEINYEEDAPTNDEEEGDGNTTDNGGFDGLENNAGSESDNGSESGGASNNQSSHSYPLQPDSVDPSLIPRMLEKARLVSRLKINCSTTHKIRDFIKKTFEDNHLPSLCPNLRSLYVDATCDAAELLPLLAPSSLGSAFLRRNRQRDEKIDPILTRLLDRAPGVTSLTIKTGMAYNTHTISQFSSLKSLNITGFFDPTAWILILQNCSQLEDVAVWASHFPEGARTSLKAIPRHDAALRSIDLRATSSAWMLNTSLLPKCRMPELRVAKVSFEDELGLDDTPTACLRTLAIQSPLLEDIAITTVSWDTSFDLAYNYFSAFRFLRHVWIQHSDADFMRLDANVERFASGIPNLETLTLHSLADSWKRPVGPSLPSLQSLARHCTKLRSLSCEINGSHFDPVSIQPPEVVFQALETFRFEQLDTFRSHTVAIARYLSRLCPHADPTVIVVNSCEIHPEFGPARIHGNGSEHCEESANLGNIKLMALVLAFQRGFATADEDDIPSEILAKAREKYISQCSWYPLQS